MVILERVIQHIHSDKWPDVNTMEGEFHQVESQFGFPSRKLFQMIVGADESNTLIVERLWPGMAAMEAAYEKVMADPDWQALVAKSSAIIKDTRYELYAVLS